MSESRGRCADRGRLPAADEDPLDPVPRLHVPNIYLNPRGRQAAHLTVRGPCATFFSDNHEYQHFQDHRRSRHRRPVDPPAPRLFLRLFLGHHLL